MTKNYLQLQGWKLGVHVFAIVSTNEGNLNQPKNW